MTVSQNLSVILIFHVRLFDQVIWCRDENRNISSINSASLRNSDETKPFPRRWLFYLIFEHCSVQQLYASRFMHLRRCVCLRVLWLPKARKVYQKNCNAIFWIYFFYITFFPLIRNLHWIFLGEWSFFEVCGYLLNTKALKQINVFILQIQFISDFI